MKDDPVHATRVAYDASADRYVEWVGTEITAASETQFDQSVLVAFADMVRNHPARIVVDVGCGPGRAASFLAAHGVDVVGVDVSMKMLLAASSAHPTIPFTQASLVALPFPRARTAGVVAWYSIIHTPPALLTDVLEEFARVIAPDGLVLVAFQVGDGDAVHREEAYGRRVSLTSYRHAHRDVERCISAAGFRTHSTVVREPELPHETTQQAFIVAQRSPE
jgi:ubiquinone/menaquinone biosynthesis C-methylase UbiE